MNDQELKIKEFRTIEAKKKQFMGLQGKFGYILAAMGQPIRVRNLPPAEKAKLRAMIDRILKK